MTIRQRGFFIVWWRCWKMVNAPWYSIERIHIATISWNIFGRGKGFES